MSMIDTWMKDGAYKMGAGKYEEAQCLLLLALVGEVQMLRTELNAHLSGPLTEQQVARKLEEFGEKIDGHLAEVKEAA